MFALYTEPTVIPFLIQTFSVLTNLTVWLIVGYLFRLAYIYKSGYILSHSQIWVFAALLVFINFLGLNINLIPITIAYLAVAWFSWKWIPIKSLKWINISMALFCLFITCTYVFFNYKLHYISYVFFSSNDIINYKFEFKPYFLVYQIGDFLGSVSYVISGEKITHVNDPLQYRIYMFYYILHTIGLTFWLIIYFDVLKKHRFTPETAMDLLKKHQIIQKVKDKHIDLPLGAIDDMDRTQSILDAAESFIDLSEKNTKLEKMEDKLEKATIKIDLQNEKEVIQLSNVMSDFSTVNNYKNQIKVFEKEKEFVNVDLNNISKGANVSNDMNFEHLENKEYELQKELLLLREKKIILKEKDLELKSVKMDLANHKVFRNLKTIDDLRYFMQIHVFAVWDFMSLLKRLQNDICCTTIPWMPVKMGNASRLINEIVIGEESDVLPNKQGYASHFELYLRAMKEVQSDTTEIDNFINNLQQGVSLENALNRIPAEAKPFVQYTLDVALNKTTSEVAGSFFNGREDVIPTMFSKLLEDWSIDKEKAPYFHYYLVRHIELDGDEHGPAGAKLINEITHGNVLEIEKMLDCSIQSVKERIALWDRVNAVLEKRVK